MLREPRKRGMRLIVALCFVRVAVVLAKVAAISDTVEGSGKCGDREYNKRDEREERWAEMTASEQIAGVGLIDFGV